MQFLVSVYMFVVDLDDNNIFSCSNWIKIRAQVQKLH